MESNNSTNFPNENVLEWDVIAICPAQLALLWDVGLVGHKGTYISIIQAARSIHHHQTHR